MFNVSASIERAREERVIQDRVAELEAELLKIIGDGTDESEDAGDDHLRELRWEKWKANQPPYVEPTPEQKAQQRADFLERGGTIQPTPFGELWWLPGIHSMKEPFKS